MTWRDIPGAFDFEAIYDNAVSTARDGDILVEVGVMDGCSLAYLAQQAMRSGKRLQVYGVDTWDADLWAIHYDKDVAKYGGPFSKALRMLQQHAPAALEFARILRCDSARAARLFDDGSVHFAFIDALHTYDAVSADIAAWRTKIRKDGILAGHDHTISYPGVERACREAFGVGGYAVIPAPPGGQDAWLKLY